MNHRLTLIASSKSNRGCLPALEIRSQQQPAGQNAFGNNLAVYSLVRCKHKKRKLGRSPPKRLKESLKDCRPLSIPSSAH